MAKRKKQLYVGVDVGGTKILAGLVDGRGRVVARRRVSTPRSGTADQTGAVIVQTIEEVIAKGGAKADGIEGIGLAVPGQIDPDKGLVVNTPNMNLGGLALAPLVEKRFGAPTVLGNDVRLGTLGEAWLGAARDAQSAVGIFIGTGIGGGFISEGLLRLGARGIAGEIGHIIMQPGGPLCGCGNRGCLEAIASRTAIEREIRAALASGEKSVITEIVEKGDVIRAGALGKALSTGDKLVKRVLADAARVVGLACLSVRHLIDPDVIVIGGGVIEACGAFMMPLILKTVDQDPLPGAKSGGRVAQAELGDDAIFLGAVALSKGFGRERPVKSRELPPVRYPKIKYVASGEIAVGTETYAGDVYIRADGKVRQRKKKAAREEYGTSHKLGPRELKKVCKIKPDILIVGTGRAAMVTLAPEGRAFLKERGIKVDLRPSAEAAKVFNRTKGRKAALIHVTC